MFTDYFKKRLTRYTVYLYFFSIKKLVNIQFVITCLNNKIDKDLHFTFLKPCKVINAKDVDFMYVELIQRCKQLFLTQMDTVDDHVYQMPSFLQSIASVLLYLDSVSGIVN